jgi:hypothetical protein
MRRCGRCGRGSGDFQWNYGLNGFLMRVVCGWAVCDGRGVSLFENTYCVRPKRARRILLEVFGAHGFLPPRIQRLVGWLVFERFYNLHAPRCPAPWFLKPRVDWGGLCAVPIGSLCERLVSTRIASCYLHIVASLSKAC